MGWAIDPKKWNISAEKDWIRKSHFDKTSQFWAALNDDEVIGRVGLYHLNPKEKLGEVSILIGKPKFRNQGFGQEMLDFVLDAGYRELKLEGIYATIFEDNDRALRFFESNNFKKSGRIGEMDYLGKKRKFYYLDHIVNN